VTGLLLAMCLPVHAPYWAPVLGGAFAIVVVKQFYGGLGKNFMNPALAARMLLLSFPGMMTTWVDALNWPAVLGNVDVVSCATPMSYLHNNQLPPLDLGQMLLGQHGGCIGEVSTFMLLLGGGYLLLRGVIPPRIPLSFLGTVALITFLTPRAGTGLEWMIA
jgi:Na+-translocating ferredoxin:NAD+ oxidoreductase RnfD subunit